MIYIKVPSSKYVVQSDDSVIYQVLLTGILAVELIHTGIDPESMLKREHNIKDILSEEKLRSLYYDGAKLLHSCIGNGDNLYLVIDFNDNTSILRWKASINCIFENASEGKFVIHSLLPIVAIKNNGYWLEYHLTSTSACHLAYKIDGCHDASFPEMYSWPRESDITYTKFGRSKEGSKVNKVKNICLSGVKLVPPGHINVFMPRAVYYNKPYGDLIQFKSGYIVSKTKDIYQILSAYKKIVNKTIDDNDKKDLIGISLLSKCLDNVIDKCKLYATNCLFPYRMVTTATTRQIYTKKISRYLDSWIKYYRLEKIIRFDENRNTSLTIDSLSDSLFGQTQDTDKRPEEEKVEYDDFCSNLFDEKPIEEYDNREFFNNNNINKERIMKDSGMFGNMMEKFKSMIVPVTDPNLKITMDGNVAVRNSEGTYVTIDSENNLVEYPADFTISVPIYVIKKPFASIQPGEIVRKGNTYAKVIGKNADGSLKCLSFSGYTTTKKGVTDFMLGASYGDVVVNIMNIQNSGINPMMLMLMNDGGETNLKDMMMFMMMSGQGGQMNPMMLMMLMGDKAGGSSKMMETMMMMSMMGGMGNMNQGMGNMGGCFNNMFGGTGFQNPFTAAFNSMNPGKNKKVVTPEPETVTDEKADE